MKKRSKEVVPVQPQAGRRRPAGMSGVLGVDARGTRGDRRGRTRERVRTGSPGGSGLLGPGGLTSLPVAIPGGEARLGLLLQCHARGPGSTLCCVAATLPAVDAICWAKCKGILILSYKTAHDSIEFGLYMTTGR